MEKENGVMKTQDIETALAQLTQRARPGGGFAAVSSEESPPRPDCTAWAAMALQACGCAQPLRQPALAMLAGYQLADGRVPLQRNFKETYWPTALALLAWHGESRQQAAARRAIDFLLSLESLTFPYDGNPASGSDSSLSGWPWVEGTYAWVVPTALALIALKAYGLENHTRVQAGVKLLLNRQLPNGGWNYGDTFVFDTQLLPFPDTTGFALEALSGLCSRHQVEKSIDYLRATIATLQSPQSLAWAVLGLGAWSARPAESTRWITRSLRLQNRYGDYDTDLLAQVIVAQYATGGLTRLYLPREA
jgi:hypothetical protein